MNQRLIEFERASHIDVYGLGKNRDQWKAALEKFAELIVQECAVIADTERPNSLGCGYITKTKGTLIKERFGVE